MQTEFFSFQSVGLTILKMFLLGGVGYGLFKTRLFKKEWVPFLSSLLIWVSFPALIFIKITVSFDPKNFPSWWVLPLISIGLSAFAFVLSYLIQKPLQNFKARREFMASCAFQNGAYFPMTLIVFLATGAFVDEMLVSIFLFMMGFNFAFWAFVPSFFSRKLEKGMAFSAFLNAPFVAIVLSVSFVFLFGKNWAPAVVREPLEMLGNICFPLVLLILGALFAESSGHESENWPALFLCVGVKLVVIPALVLVFIKWISFNPTYQFLLFLEAAMPTALTIALIGKQEGADNQFLSGMILYSHLASLMTIPIWFIIFGKFF